MISSSTRASAASTPERVNALRLTSAIVSAGALLVAQSRPLQADAGALSFELAGGASLLSVRAPNATAAAETGTAWSLALGASYALTSKLELGVHAFFEPPEQFVHDNASITTDAGTFKGSLTERSSRLGAAIRVRRLFGLVWRPVVGIDAGWSHRTFSRLDLVDGSTGRSFLLQLPEASQDALLLAPAIGLRWTDDHIAFGIEPRVELLVARQTTWSVVVPLTISWSWYL
jgi:hypothetical protein